MLARVAFFAIFAFSATACEGELPAPLRAAHGGGPAEGAVVPTRGGVLELASFADIRALDPANLTDGLAPQMAEALFAGLVDFDAEGKVRADLAERWTVEDGGKTYRFVLRQGARFHDGEEVTSDDVKRSVERALHPSAPNPLTSYFESLAGYAAFTGKKAEHLDGVVTSGRYGVTFRLDRPDAIFLPCLAMLALRPTCKSAGDRYADTWEPCGAGPFKLPPGGWDRGRQLRLVRHEGYHIPGLPRLDGVRWTFHVNPTSQRFKLTRGELGMMRDFLSPDLVAFQADPRWKPFGAFEADKQVDGEVMNTEVPPFDNVEIRRAVAAAVDREQLRKVRPTNMRVLGRPLPPGVQGYDEAVPEQRFDLEAALEHMRKAGHPYDPVTGRGGWPHPIPYLVYKQGLSEGTAQVLAQQLARIGLRLEIRIVNYPTFMALVGRRKQSAMSPGFWQQDFPGALSFLEPLWSSRSINEEDSNNWSFYKDARVDDLLDRARREPTEERRNRLTSDAQRILVEDAPWAFTYGYRAFVQQQPYVRELPPHPVWSVELTKTWLDRAAGPVASRALFGRGGARGALATLLDGRAR
jgi:ABC-type transport system substrate-binding protein